jgi:hypothetical protein
MAISFGISGCFGVTTSPVPTQSTQQIKEKAYLDYVNPFIDTFYKHRSDYNIGMKQVGEKFTAARNENEQRQALQEVVNFLESTNKIFQKDRDDFAQLLPPTKYYDFYLMMNSVLNDYVFVFTSYTSYYSKNLNLGTQDLYLLDKASDRLRTVNENLQRAGLMLAQLIKGN